MWNLVYNSVENFGCQNQPPFPTLEVQEFKELYACQNAYNSKLVEISDEILSYNKKIRERTKYDQYNIEIITEDNTFYHLYIVEGDVDPIDFI